MDSTRISSTLQLAQVAASNWELVQVELQGKYSIERMRELYAYSIQTHWYRILLWCIVTPIPCLVVNILLDAAPLAPPSAGRDANYVIWARMGIFAVIVNYWMLIQIGYLAPALGMKPWHALSTAIVVGIACAINAYELAGLIAMPVPFILIIATPAYLTPTIVMFIIYFGRRIKNDPTLRASLNRASTIIHLQIFLTFIYPAFIYGFNSIPSKYQTPFMILIPVTKIVAKNIMSRLIGNNHDLKPVELIFNIDCFNAIYVSLAMQRATTISTSLVIMLIDSVQGCVSVYDVYQRFQPLKRFMNELPASHPLHGKNFLEVAITLDQVSDFVHRNIQSLFSIPCGPAFDTKSFKPPPVKTMRSTSTKVFVAPHKSKNREAAWSTHPNLCSPERRVAFSTKRLTPVPLRENRMQQESYSSRQNSSFWSSTLKSLCRSSTVSFICIYVLFPFLVMIHTTDVDCQVSSWQQRTTCPIAPSTRPSQESMSTSFGPWSLAFSCTPVSNSRHS